MSYSGHPEPYPALFAPKARSRRYAGACVGKQSLDVLIKGLSQQILSRGYITMRVLLPEQDLSSGTLKIALIPGVIRRVRFSDETLRGTWKTASRPATVNC